MRRLVQFVSAVLRAPEKNEGLFQFSIGLLNQVNAPANHPGGVFETLSFQDFHDLQVSFHVVSIMIDPMCKSNRAFLNIVHADPPYMSRIRIAFVQP
jgi:hypothetical protein